MVKSCEKKINFEWESDEERLKRWMKIPPKKKLEWLEQIRELTLKSASKRDRKLRQKLRELL